MEREDFCGVSVVTECPEIEIQGIPALDFQIYFIDAFASLISKSKQPQMAPKFFEADTQGTNQVVISPTDIDNLNIVQTARGFGYRLQLFTNETDVTKAYSTILSMVKVIVNIIEAIKLRKQFMYTVRFTVSQSGEAFLTVTITKTI